MLEAIATRIRRYPTELMTRSYHSRTEDRDVLEIAGLSDREHEQRLSESLRQLNRHGNGLNRCRRHFANHGNQRIRQTVGKGIHATH